MSTEATRPSSITTPTDTANNSESLVQILQSQRDRFKERLQTVERQLQDAQQTLATLRADKAELEQDNLDLYGKIRYLQGYAFRTQQGGHTQDARSDQLGRRSLAAAEEGRRELNTSVEGKYRQLYEQKMNPFAQFSQSEKQRK